MIIHRSRRPRRRGAVMLFFLLVALPLVWVAGAIAVDYSKIITTRHQAEMLLDAASLAATAEIVTGDCSSNLAEECTAAGPNGGLGVDPVLAAASARALCTRALEAGAERFFGPDACSSGLQVEISPDGLSVSVRMDYRIDGLMFFGVIDRNAGWSSVPASSVSTSRVCISTGVGPGLDPVNGGACSRTR
jgi:uncharacterized membrane protein